jgi:hypothetical protein
MLHIFPKGNDRSWTREKYYTLNKILRRIEYEQRPQLPSAINEAFEQAIKYGFGYMRFPGLDLGKIQQ